MFFRTYLKVLEDGVWRKVLSLGVILFLVFCGDAILSFWVPNFFQETLKSPFFMGLVMGFSSLIGLLSDLVLPQLIKNLSVKKLLTMGILMGLLFAFMLFFSIYASYILVFLTAMLFWGLYYELIGFGEQQFVADSTPLNLHSAAWGLLSSLRSFAYFLGPILGAFLIDSGWRNPVIAALFIVAVGLFALTLTKDQHKRQIDEELHSVSFLKEISYWKELFVHVWPIVVMSLFIGIIDATFWTTGATLTEKLSQQNYWGKFYLPLYMLPSLFVGILIARRGVVRGKKKMAQKHLLLAGIFLSLIGFLGNVYLELICVFVIGIFLAISFPLTDATYSDILARMGKEKSHLIGLSRSTTSLAYIIGPVWAGFIASQVGEKMAFSFIGFTVIVISIILLMTTPRRLRLSQKEINNWE